MARTKRDANVNPNLNVVFTCFNTSSYTYTQFWPTRKSYASANISDNVQKKRSWKINASKLGNACKVEICWPWPLMGRMGAERLTQDDFERRKLVLPIEVEGRQERTKQVDLRVEFIMDRRINLQNNEIIQKPFEELHWRKICRTGLGCETEISRKMALRGDKRRATTHFIMIFEDVYRPVSF